jgi:adhesin transport system membrane fusion protein
MPSITVWLFIGFAVFVLWASVFELDQAVQTSGQIIPGARTQIVQVADGGVLEKLLVREGQRVVAGETLAILERERAIASYEESLVKLTAQSAGLIRANAEIGGYEPVFGSEFEAFPDFVQVQRGHYEQRKQSLSDSTLMFKERLSIAEEMLSINQTLAKDGDISRMDVLQAKRDVAQLKGDLMGVKNDYYQTAQEEAVRLQAELASSRYQLDQRRSVLSHTELTSPATGIVKYLSVNTLGGVLRAGDELMQISPTDDDMIIEVKVNPVDIGLLEIGLPVSISLDAFDYSIYGTLAGSLIYISSDTLVEEVSGQSQTYYRVNVQIDNDALIANPRLANVELKPGMTVNASIRTGKRTVLRYLLKPINRGFYGALSEG